MIVQRLFEIGYPYELIGLVYFVLYLQMTRKGVAQRFSQRTKALTLVAAIVLVGAVPFHYGANAAGIVLMLVLAVLALVATLVDRTRPPA